MSLYCCAMTIKALNLIVSLCLKCFILQDSESDLEVVNTTADSGVSDLPVVDSTTEEPQAKPNTKGPVRFGWVTGVMVSGGCVYMNAK